MSEDCRCANSYYRNKPKVKLESETTHNANFKPHPIEPTPSLVPPKIVQKHYDPELLQSSYKSTYTKPPINQASSYDASLISQYYQNKPKHGPFPTETEYNKSYQKTNVPSFPPRSRFSRSQHTNTSRRTPNSRGSPAISPSLCRKIIPI